jgi:hypothetical protein
MQKVFDAANAVEAHMVLHMLENHGIEGRIEGEHLSGGVGELPAFGLVRVLVGETDVERARSIIAEWEKPQRDATQRETSSGPRPATLGAFAIGALLGGLGVFWYYAAAAVDEPGRDFNGDGIPDEKLTWSGAALSTTEEDRNADGRVDARWEFDSQGRAHRQHWDADFDGDMETVTTYRNDLPVYTEVSHPRSQADLRHHFLFGVQYYSEIVDRASGRVVKRYTYEGPRLAREEYDADRDGTLETVRTYDDFEEVLATTRQ